MSNDAFGRDHLAQAWATLFGRDAALHERQTVQAVARGEGGYGLAKYRNQITGESAVLNNWGATQCPHGPPCGDKCFEVTDTHGPEWQAAHPGEDPHYQWCYNRYVTPEEGAVAYLVQLKRIVDRHEPGFFGALATGSTDVFVAAMRAGGYFELRLDLYQARVWANVNELAHALGEPLAVHKEDDGSIFGGSGDDPLATSSSTEEPPTSDGDSASECEPESGDGS